MVAVTAPNGGCEACGKDRSPIDFSRALPWVQTHEENHHALIRALEEERDALRAALEAVVTWFPLIREDFARLDVRGLTLLGAPPWDESYRQMVMKVRAALEAWLKP